MENGRIPERACNRKGKKRHGLDNLRVVARDLYCIDCAGNRKKMTTVFEDLPPETTTQRNHRFAKELKALI